MQVHGLVTKQHPLTYCINGKNNRGRFICSRVRMQADTAVRRVVLSVLSRPASHSLAVLVLLQPCSLATANISMLPISLTIPSKISSAPSLPPTCGEMLDAVEHADDDTHLNSEHKEQVGSFFQPQFRCNTCP